MAFNIMNVSNIEVSSKMGYLTPPTMGFITVISAPPANTIYKIKSGQITGNTTFRIEYAGVLTGSLYPSSYAGGQGFNGMGDYLKDFVLTEGNSLKVAATSSSGVINYIITYEIWT